MSKYRADVLRVAWALLLTSEFCACRSLCADEGAAPDAQSGQRLEMMQSAIADVRVTSEDIEPKAALTFVPQPLLRYGDPTRGLLDAGVWRLGEAGRPTALLTLEVYPEGDGAAHLQYEFVSLTPHKFAARSPRGVAWDAAQTDLKMVELPDAPEPAATERLRLIQMRELVRRFSASETTRFEEQVECRMMPQPIDRYAAPEADTVDGAMFVFANGTNPEIGLLLETDGQKWRYGAFRMAGARCSARLDDVTFVEFPLVEELATSAERNTYAISGHGVQLPQ